jgi:hypothetical protein
VEHAHRRRRGAAAMTRSIKRGYPWPPAGKAGRSLRWCKIVFHPRPLHLLDSLGFVVKL